jgi:hypothetical protein
MIPARSRFGAVVVSLLGGALLMAGCAAGNPAGTGKPSPSPKPTTSTSTGSGKYLPSKWVNSKGVFVAPADSGASASLKAQWETAYGVFPPPQGFVSGLGQVPVTNLTNVSQGEADQWGQAFLVDQGYEDYFLAAGSSKGVAAVANGNVIPDYSAVSADLAAGVRVYVVGCALPISLTLVTIPSSLKPPAGDSYGLMASFKPLANGGCQLQGATVNGPGATIWSGTDVPDLYEGRVTSIPALGSVWVPLGALSCPSYQVGGDLAAACGGSQGS